MKAQPVLDLMAATEKEGLAENEIIMTTAGAGIKARI